MTGSVAAVTEKLVKKEAFTVSLSVSIKHRFSAWLLCGRSGRKTRFNAGRTTAIPIIAQKDSKKPLLYNTYGLLQINITAAVLNADSISYVLPSTCAYIIKRHITNARSPDSAFPVIRTYPVIKSVPAAKENTYDVPARRSSLYNAIPTSDMCSPLIASRCAIPLRW